MDAKPSSRGRGGGWRRGGRSGNDSDSYGGEHRGRGRSHHRGRGKRDHYRGRGRGGSAYSAECHHRHRDEEDNFEEENTSMEVFSRRKLESNWDRYKESERQEPEDDTPTQRGTDYHVLLEAAGDSFTQFRFSEEKDWEMDSFTTSQMSAVFVDLPALANSLQQVPLHQRLNLEAELVQVSTPVELPVMSLKPKQETPKPALSAPPVPEAASPALLSEPRLLPGTLKSAPLNDDDDEELDRLLGLQKAVSGESGNQPVSVAAADEAPEKVCEEVKQAAEEKMEVVKDEDVTPPKAAAAASIRKEVTEEELEDWLDSMIS
ncbi:uncharacterized protein V6R79_017663 [Siganus canaliculatus]